MLDPHNFIIDQADTVVNIVMLILCIRHVISLHVENEDVVTKQPPLPVQYIVHLRLVLKPLQVHLLRRVRGKAEVLDHLAPRAIHVAGVRVEQFGLLEDVLRHHDLLTMVFVGVELLR